MKQVTLTPRLKRRYNLCHRLRTKGVSVDVDNHAIQLSGQEQYDELAGIARKYVDALMKEYQYVVQFTIPDLYGSEALKFRRRAKSKHEAQTHSASI